MCIRDSKETAQALWSIYFSLTVLCALLYYINGMSVFDAVSHAMSTVAIGGFSTHNESSGFFNSFSIELICITFMLLAAFSFTLHYFAIYKRKPLKYVYDAELRFFFSILLLIILTSLLLSTFNNVNSSPSSREILFHSVSMLTTTGFSISSTTDWPFSISFLLSPTPIIIVSLLLKYFTKSNIALDLFNLSPRVIILPPS